MEPQMETNINALGTDQNNTLIEQKMRESSIALRSANGLQHDVQAAELMCELGMRGYLVYPCEDGGYWVGMDGTLTRHKCTDDLGRFAESRRNLV